MVSVIVEMPRNEFEDFLWDNGVRLPFPLHLGPCGPVGISPIGGSAGREFDEALALRSGRWPASTVVALADLLRVMEAPEAVAFAYSIEDDRDEPGTRHVVAAVVRGDEASLIVEAPSCVRLASLTWPEVGVTVAGQLPPMPGLAMTRSTVQVQELKAVLQAVARGASLRTVERMSVAAGAPPGLHARLAEVSARARIKGFLGASRENGRERVMSPISGDFFAAADGGVLRWGDEVELTFEPVSLTSMARVLGTALSRLPSLSPARYTDWAS